MNDDKIIPEKKISPSLNGGPRTCIHIGLPKTATKTLQWHLFTGHSQIDYLGRFIGRPYRKYRRYDQCRDSHIQALMREIAWGDHVSRPDLQLCRRIISRSIRPALEQGRVPLWSWESLSTDSLTMRRLRAENLHRVLGECRVFVTIRRPVDLLESAYFQILKRETMNPEMRTGLFGRNVPYFTIEQWLEKCFDGEIMHHLEYAGTIEMYSEIFGGDNVRVYLFEELREDFQAFMRSLCGFIGIDPEEGVRLTRGKNENTRWTREQIERLRRVDRSRLKLFLFNLPTGIPRRLMIGDTSFGGARNAPEARARIPGKWRERIDAATREGNRRLAESRDLPMEHYGYPL